MYRSTIIVSVGVVALLAASARAGFVSINVEPLDGELQGTAINIDEQDGSAEVRLDESWGEGQESFGVAISGETDEDPVMTITKVVENTTGLAWIGYQIDLLNPGGATFQGAPTNSDLTFDAGASTSTSLVFGLPDPLPSGQAITFTFDINVPTTGDFGFTLAQHANVIPEPATLLMGLLMAGAGTAAALRYRWG